MISKEIKIITAGSKDIIENKSMYKDLKSRGILIMAFSSNNEEFIKTNIGKYFTQIYTDFWNISESTCSVLVCKTY